MPKIIFILLFIQLLQNSSLAQDQHTIDSLQNEIKKLDAIKKHSTLTPKDSTKANLFYQISKLYWDSSPDKALTCAEQCLTLSEKIGYKKGVLNGYTSKGVVTEIKGNYKEALEFYQKSLKIAQEINYKTGIANACCNIGNIYNYQCNTAEAITQYFAALKIYEEIKDEKNIATQYNNIGGLYIRLKNYEEALKNLNLSLQKREKLGRSSDISESYINIGNVYNLKGNIIDALKNYYEALSISEKINDKQSIAIVYGNIAKINEQEHDYPLAIKNLLNSLKIKEEISDKLGMANSNVAIGSVYDGMNDYKNAISYETKGLLLAKELGAYDLMKEAYKNLAVISANHKDYKSAYENHVLFKKTNDTLFNFENANKITQLKMQADYDKKDAVAKEEQKKKDEVTKTQIEQQAFQRNAFVAGFALMMVLAGVSYRNFRRKRKDNLIITKQKETVEQQKETVEKQKQLVEQKNKEITQSIEYALRIQSAILPSGRFVKQHLKNSFILYKPKDIVAGDFYWMETVQLADETMKLNTDEGQLQAANQIILFAACDCTGHGVPGAMVSVLCHNALNRAVREFGLTQPAAILDKTAEIIIDNFSKSEEDIKDGMDISLCSLTLLPSVKGSNQPATYALQWAGANNPLLLLQNGELKETKADKQPIGMNENSKPFTNHTFTVHAGETIYLFTDGFSDQFGGETGEKKLTKKRFKDLILSIRDKTMHEQGIALDTFITGYRKDVEQIDDILVMGVRL